MSLEALAQAAKAVAESSHLVALTGAGISAESGVPTFRGPDGLWRQFRPEDLASPEAFGRHPELVWEWYRWRRQRLAQARPNPGHECLARLQRRRPRGFALVTQNVDGLHQQAGSTGVLELHGNIWRTVCVRRCGVSRDESPWSPGGEAGSAELQPDRLPQCPCGALLRPDVVWFGESLDPAVLGAAVDAAERADVVLVIGSSGLVHPAASLPGLASRAGATIIEVNVDLTPLSAQADIVLRGPSGILLPQLESAL